MVTMRYLTSWCRTPGVRQRPLCSTRLLWLYIFLGQQCPIFVLWPFSLRSTQVQISQLQKKVMFQRLLRCSSSQTLRR